MRLHKHPEVFKNEVSSTNLAAYYRGCIELDFNSLLNSSVEVSDVGFIKLFMSHT